MVETGQSAVRDEMIERMRQDLVGTLDEAETLTERPSDRYLTGILYPPGEAVASEEDDAIREETGQTDSDADTGEVPIYRSMRPSTFGLSFRVRARRPELRIQVSGGRYEAVHSQAAEDEESDDSSVSEATARASGTLKRHLRETSWRRTPLEAFATIAIEPGLSAHPLDMRPLDLRCSIRAKRLEQDLWGVTAVVSNESAASGEGPIWTEEHALYQAWLRIQPGKDTDFIPRPPVSGIGDDEERSSTLLYRDVREWAVGHTSGAIWRAEGDRCDEIATDWLPTSRVQSVSSLGSTEFSDWSNSSDGSAAAIAAADDSALLSGLQRLTASYRSWLGKRSEEAASIAIDLQPTAQEHLGRCLVAAERMEHGIDLLRHDSSARRAFRLANEAMVLQRRAQTSDEDLRWRPFQIGFQLMCLPSLAKRGHPDRSIMDLLWFPTGGGKTEAYLGLIAFLLFHRRLRNQGSDKGAGTAAIMRYTLRVLTTQQFQRAASMICAAETIRLRETDMGTTPFSIGLWIGADAIPNKLAEARRDPSSVKVLTACPNCGSQLTNPSANELRPKCRNPECIFSTRSIPVHVVDEDIYDVRPSLLVATVDKFAQITREPRTNTIFSLDGRHEPPDLVLQDELHLISGPLGTLAGIYEIAIDEFCRNAAGPAKVIGSTATIRRAKDQVRALFDRSVQLFPPPGLVQADSGFAITDRSHPGRTYVGVTTAGRSPKFALQAVLSGLLQAPYGLLPRYDAASVDPYWTCVSYFNSLRELGGAVVLVEDDVRRSIVRLASLRNEKPRDLETPSEITSRVPTNEIPEVLGRLAASYPDSEVDIVLASNMISVGVDVPRLGLMVVNGQPKTTAEYIQATSRVGRGETPGLVIVVYNAQRPRDRSRYESFLTWHRALYRDVEPTSVTPFAARARDKALHAPLVAMVRHLHPAANDEPALGKRAAAARAVAERILERVRDIDPTAVEETRIQLAALIDDWGAKPHLAQWWWWRERPAPSLLIGAEDHAAIGAEDRTIDAWPTPNSMREVEPSTRFRFAPALAVRERQ